MKYFIIIFFISISHFVLGQSFSCSGFMIKNDNVFLAKNFDWSLGNGLIIFNPKNILKSSIYSESKKNTWTSKYSSITFNHLGLNQPLGGMNEEGLTIEELSTWPVEYYQSNDLSLSEFEWIQYHLDKYSTTTEVLANVEQISITKFYFQVHYLIVDKYGDMAIIEYIGGKPKIYHNESLIYPILTNNNYSELIKYTNLVPKSHYNKLDVNNSQDRFLKIATLLKRLKNSYDSTNYLHTMNILDSVKVDDTQWSIVYDIGAKTIYYKTKIDTNIKKILFSQSLMQENKVKYIGIGLDKQNEFMVFNYNDNIKYLKNLKEDIIKHYGDEGLGLVKRINNYLK